MVRYFEHSTDKAIGPWTPQEDAQLFSAVMKQVGLKIVGVEVAAQVPTRSFHQCKQRWVQHVKPASQRLGKWTDDEDVLLSKAVTKHARMDDSCQEVPGRSNVQCKNGGQHRLFTAVNGKRSGQRKESMLAHAIKSTGRIGA
jgi:S-ribosylhomocysteine lyase LuxS involved in autoinducer biosynthesis